MVRENRFSNVLFIYLSSLQIVSKWKRKKKFDKKITEEEKNTKREPRCRFFAYLVMIGKANESIRINMYRERERGENAYFHLLLWIELILDRRKMFKTNEDCFYFLTSTCAKVFHHFGIIHSKKKLTQNIFV